MKREIYMYEQMVEGRDNAEETDIQMIQDTDNEEERYIQMVEGRDIEYLVRYRTILQMIEVEIMRKRDKDTGRWYKVSGLGQMM